MRQKLKITTTDDRFYRQYLELIKVFPPVNKLSNAELNVLAEIMRTNNETSKKFKDPEDGDKWPLVMSASSRKDMRDRISIPEASWNNALSALRKAGILVDNVLTAPFRVYPQRTNTIGFEFNIKEGTEVRVPQRESGRTGDSSRVARTVPKKLQTSESEHGVYDIAGSGETGTDG